MSQIGDCYTAHRCSLLHTKPLPSSLSGLVGGDEDLLVTPKPETHTFLRISQCTLIHIQTHAASRHTSA